MSDLLQHLRPSRTTLWLLASWLVLSLTQTLHFYTYFEQSLWDSVRWSFRDWFVWYLIFWGVFELCKGRQAFARFSVFSTLLVGAIAVASGVLQTAIITSLDFIAGTASRPFWEDFSHFYAKRWLQYLFIFALFWMLLLNRIVAGTPAPVPSAAAAPKPQRIRIDDGKQHHWVAYGEVLSVEAAGNYVCFHTTSGQLIARGTLKALQAQEQVLHRVSRSRMVNPGLVAATRRSSNGGMDLVLTDGSVVPVGPSYRRQVKALLGLPGGATS
ncbi:MAG: LytTR family DNA-binding domain-containing protein [Pseudomonadota bacterium]